MLKSEFETLAGYEVTDNDYYKIIEPMYYAVNLDKKEFVKTLNKERFAMETIDHMCKRAKAIAEYLKRTCDHFTDYKKKGELDQILSEIKERKGAAGFLINDSYTLEHLGEMRGCSYPSSVEFYDSGYRTIKTIKLI